MSGILYTAIPRDTFVAHPENFIVIDFNDEPIPEPEAFLDDGYAETLCDKTLFRVHTAALSFHSPVLRQMFSPPSLPTGAHASYPPTHQPISRLC